MGFTDGCLDGIHVIVLAGFLACAIFGVFFGVFTWQKDLRLGLHVVDFEYDSMFDLRIAGLEFLFSIQHQLQSLLNTFQENELKRIWSWKKSRCSYCALVRHLETK
jgi:hypothetical protein